MEDLIAIYTAVILPTIGVVITFFELKRKIDWKGEAERLVDLREKLTLNSEAYRRIDNEINRLVREHTSSLPGDAKAHNTETRWTTGSKALAFLLIGLLIGVAGLAIWQVVDCIPGLVQGFKNLAGSTSSGFAIFIGFLIIAATLIYLAIIEFVVMLVYKAQQYFSNRKDSDSKDTKNANEQKAEPGEDISKQKQQEKVVP